MGKMRIKPLTNNQEKMLLDNYLKIAVKPLAKMIGVSSTKLRGEIKRRGLIIPKEIIESRKKLSQFQKGSIPKNKGLKQTQYMSKEAIKRTELTRFKKGFTPVNAKKDGEISIRVDHKNRNGKSYKWIRLGPGYWMPLHQYIWENANGKRPKNHVIWFKDGDTMNCDLSNLELISQSESMYRNSSQNYAKEVIPTMLILNKIKKELKSIENGK